MYYDFSTPVSKMTGYRTLAVNRGEKEKFITVKIEAPVNDIISYLKKQIIVRDNPETEQILSDAIADSYDRLIAPAIEREIRNALTETAEDGAIKVFASNLQQLLIGSFLSQGRPCSAGIRRSEPAVSSQLWIRPERFSTPLSYSQRHLRRRLQRLKIL